MLWFTLKQAHRSVTSCYMHQRCTAYRYTFAKLDNKQAWTHLSYLLQKMLHLQWPVWICIFWLVILWSPKLCIFTFDKNIVHQNLWNILKIWLLMKLEEDIYWYILTNFLAWGNAILYVLIVSRLLKILHFDFTIFIPPTTQNDTHKYTITQYVSYRFRPFFDHLQGDIQQ